MNIIKALLIFFVTSQVYLFLVIEGYSTRNIDIPSIKHKLSIRINSRQIKHRTSCFTPFYRLSNKLLNNNLIRQTHLKLNLLPSPVKRHFRRGECYAMFTGIVEDVGKVVGVERDAEVCGWDGRRYKGALRIRVKSDVGVRGCYEGCSVAVNGVCLTVTKFNNWNKNVDNTNNEKASRSDENRMEDSDSRLPENSFETDITPETIRRSNLGFLEVGDFVNIERAALINSNNVIRSEGEKAGEEGSRNSGHNVQGHVDTVGKIISVWNDGEAKGLKIQYRNINHQTNINSQNCTVENLRNSNDEHTGLVVEKGFVALDGISLTVTEVEGDCFSIMLIPHTQHHTTLSTKTIGDLVNIEFDIFGKYVAAMAKNHKNAEVRSN